jgi:tetratricopeptide (TPR) repeat protein
MQAGRPDTHEQGRAAFEQVAREFPDRWEAEAGLAQFFALRRNYTEAVKHFARAAELGSADAEMYLRYGRALISANRATDSLPVFRKATELDPASEEARVALAVAYTRAGEFRDAIEAFQKIKIVTPHLLPSYFYHFAYACYRVGAIAEAKELVAKGRVYLREAPDVSALDRLSQMLEAADR